MKILVFTLCICFQTLLVAQASALKVGDVILQPLDCWACSLIEAEEASIYSHIGVVIAVRPNVLIAEAFGKVRSTSLETFNKRTEAGQKSLILRFQNPKIVKAFETRSKELNQIFAKDFEFKKYDHDFLWNNFDETGAEKFYCSELVAKLFQAFLSLETPLKKMHFEQNREQWNIYFRGNIPDGKWGNSPSDYEHSELFYVVGEL